MTSWPVTQVLEALREALAGGCTTEAAVTRTLRAQRLTLDAEGRERVARRVFGTSLWRRALTHRSGRSDAAGLLGAYVMQVEGAAPSQAASASALAEADLLAMLRHRPTAPHSMVELLGVTASLPPWLAGLWLAELGFAEALTLSRAINRPGPLTVRVNRARSTVEEVAERLARRAVEVTACRHAPAGLHLTRPVNVHGLPEWQDGLLEVQDEGSQLVALACRVQPGERVVDCCAGRGGKSLALAEAAGPGGQVVALDLSGERLASLSTRARRHGLRQLTLRAVDVTRADLSDETADVVLVDAPCSALGTLRRGPGVRWELDPGTLAAFPQLQRELLRSAARAVRPGGRLVYATCTIRDDENCRVAAHFDETHRRFSRLPAGQVLPGWPEPDAPQVMLWPHRHGTDGFFISGWQRAR